MDSKQKKEPNESSKKQVTLLSAFGFAGEFGLIIAIPLLAFVSLGKYLDNKMKVKYFVLIAILLSLAVSTFLIYKSIKKIINSLKR